MVLLKMHKDYLNTEPAWKTKLETHAGRLNPKKEEVKILFSNKTSLSLSPSRNYIFIQIIREKMMLLLEH
jgi:hypothetical protein